MHNAVGNKSKEVWSAKVSMGLSWMKSTGVPNVESKIGNNSKIIILMGVNDLGNATNGSYAKYINSKANAWTKKGANVYFVSINPVDEAKEKQHGYHVTNKNINLANKKIKNALNSKVKYINTNKNINFTTTDGLHYNNATYKKIYKYIKNNI